MSGGKLFKLERGSVGNVACQICGQIHIPANKCSNDALVNRIQRLMESNLVIPSILHANKEAVDLAQYFQDLNKRADYGFTLIQEICVRHGDVGAAIQKEFMEGLDSWLKENTNQNTPQETQSTEQLTSSETEDKNSTPTQDGQSSLLILPP